MSTKSCKYTYIKLVYRQLSAVCFVYLTHRFSIADELEQSMELVS